MPPGADRRGRRTTMPLAMAAMPTQVIQGLCSRPPHVRAPRRPPGKSTRWISASATAGSGGEHQPHAARHDVEGGVGAVDGRGVDDRGLDVAEPAVAPAGGVDHAWGDVAEDDRVRSVRPAVTTSARGSRGRRRARAPGRRVCTATCSTSRRVASVVGLSSLVRVGVPRLAPPRSRPRLGSWSRSSSLLRYSWTITNTGVV